MTPNRGDLPFPPPLHQSILLLFLRKTTYHLPITTRRLGRLWMQGRRNGDPLSSMRTIDISSSSSRRGSPILFLRSIFTLPPLQILKDTEIKIFQLRKTREPFSHPPTQGTVRRKEDRGTGVQQQQLSWRASPSASAASDVLIHPPQPLLSLLLFLRPPSQLQSGAVEG